MKQEIKMGYEWYRTLTKKQQKQWRKNRLDNIRWHGAKMKFFYADLNNSMTKRDFLYTSFIFSTTPQGIEYWRNIANKNK